MRDMEIEHPDITRVLREGLPEGEEYPHCPVCGEEALMFYRNTLTAEVVGCENCIEAEYA